MAVGSLFPESVRNRFRRDDIKSRVGEMDPPAMQALAMVLSKIYTILNYSYSTGATHQKRFGTK